MTLVLGSLALLVSLVALWLSADGQRKIANKNTEIVQAYIKPLKEAILADRKENNKLRQQVKTCRDMIDALNEKVKYLEDDMKSSRRAATVAAAKNPAQNEQARQAIQANQANGTNG